MEAGNTTKNLAPIAGVQRSSERLVTENITTKPEPIEVIAAAVLEPEPEQQEQFARASQLEKATLPKSAAPVKPAAPSGSPSELDELKQQINESFSEVANLLLDLQSRFENLEERLNKFNARSSQKI